MGTGLMIPRLIDPVIVRRYRPHLAFGNLFLVLIVMIVGVDAYVIALR